MRQIVFAVERHSHHQFIARAEAGNRSIKAAATSSIDLHRRARDAVRVCLGSSHSECRILLEKRYPGLESLCCTFWPFLDADS